MQAGSRQCPTYRAHCPRSPLACRRPNGSGWLPFDFWQDPYLEYALFFEREPPQRRRRLFSNGAFEWRFHPFHFGCGRWARGPAHAGAFRVRHRPCRAALPAGLKVDGAFSDQVHTLARYMGKNKKNK